MDHAKAAAAAGSGLEASLLQIVQEHQQRSLHHQERTEKAKKDALSAAVRVSDVLVHTVNDGVEKAFINEKRIELEIRALMSTCLRFTKQTNQWLVASQALNTALKEIGDFENWMKTMEYDCKNITVALHNIHKT